MMVPMETTTPSDYADHGEAVVIARVPFTDRSTAFDADGLPVFQLYTVKGAVAFDDFREEQGMSADDRATCWSHQCWADEAHLATHNF